MASGPVSTGTTPKVPPTPQQTLDIYINSIFGPTKTFQAQGLLKGQEVPNTRILQDLAKSANSPIIGAFSPTIPVNWQASSYFEHPDITTPDTMVMWYFEGPIICGLDQFTSAIAVAGNPFVVKCVTQVLEMFGDRQTLCPLNTWLTNVFAPSADPGLAGFTLKNFEYYIITSDNIYEFISEATIDGTVKILSAYNLIFPSCRTFLQDNCTVRMYVPQSRATSGRATATEAQRMAAVVFLIWVPAFSQIGKIPGQMFRRYTAMNADGRLVNVTEQDFVGLLTDSGWSMVNIPSVVNATVGRVVALESDGTYNPAVGLAELMTLDEYMDLYDPADIAKGILEQCRLIYENYQATSIGFGAAVVNLVDQYCTSLGSPWADEVVNIQKVRADVMNCKYTGCIDTIPEYRQVKSSPRVIYIGVLYYAKCLTDKEEIENFKQYNVDGVKHHISRIEDRTTCESIVDFLPTPDIVSIAALAEGLGVAEVEKICQSRGATFRIALFHQLYAKHSKSAWFKREWDSKEQNAKSLALKGILKVIEDQYQSTMGNITSKIAHSADMEERTAYRRKQAELEDQYVTSKMKLVTLDDLVASSPDVMFSHVRSGLLSQYKGLWHVACGLPPQSTDGEDVVVEDQQDSTPPPDPQP